MRRSSGVPSPSETYRRARRLANISLWTVQLQCRRLRAKEPEDSEFLFRRWTDFQFLIIALTRLRRAAVLAARVSSINADIQVAITAFDLALPSLKRMRDVAEHFDEYAVDEGRRQDIRRRSLEVAIVGEDTLTWLDDGSSEPLSLTLNIDEAFRAGSALFRAIRDAQSVLTSQPE